MGDLEKIVVEFSNAFGPSGFEKEVREIFRRWVVEHAEISYDQLGSIIAIHHGSSERPKIMLASHLDEVGLMVRGILPGGYLKAVPLGSWWPPTLLAQRVAVRTKNGDLFGVIGAKPPHFLSEEEQNRPLKMTDLYIDLGLRNSEEAVAFGIEVGNPVVPAVQAEILGAGGTIIGKGFDDRAGCAAVVQILRELNETHPNMLIGAGTVQEENGLKGAQTVTSLIQPDLCLVLEGTPADDFPGAGDLVQGRLRGGPQIRRYDPSMIANQALVNLATGIAKKLGIPYQIAVRETGATDGRQIQLGASGGVPTMVIGVPVRYSHSHQGLINLTDLEATVQLVKAMVEILDEFTVADLRKNPW